MIQVEVQRKLLYPGQKKSSLPHSDLGKETATYLFLAVIQQCLDDLSKRLNVKEYLLACSKTQFKSLSIQREEQNVCTVQHNEKLCKPFKECNYSDNITLML